MAVVLLWQRTATAWETMRPYSQGGDTPPSPLPFSQALRKFLAWGIREGWAFFVVVV